MKEFSQEDIQERDDLIKRLVEADNYLQNQIILANQAIKGIRSDLESAEAGYNQVLKGIRLWKETIATDIENFCEEQKNLDSQGKDLGQQQYWKDWKEAYSCWLTDLSFLDFEDMSVLIPEEMDDSDINDIEDNTVDIITSLKKLPVDVESIQYTLLGEKK